MAHRHPVYDTDKHFSINPITRALKNEASSKVSVVQHDHNSERFTFEIPRKVEDHDMSLCNVIQVHYLNIDAQTKEQNPGLYEVDDMQISPENEDTIVLSWLISGNATKLVGSLNFLIRFMCVSEGASVDYVWNTAIFSGISVSNGISNGDVIVEEYADILEQWRQALIEGAQAAVLYTQQDLTKEEQAQARKNIGIDDEVITRIQKDIADLKYFPIDITQITGGKTVEMGSVINEVTIGWTLNKEPASQTVDGESVDVSARSKAFTGLAISANKTFTLAVTDERGATDSASASLSFLNGVYYGVLEQGVSLDSAAILKLTRKLQGAKGITFTANAGATQQIVYALPARYGTPGFNVGGFDGGFTKAKTFDFKNASGYTESYDVWLSENVGLGNTTVKVS